MPALIRRLILAVSLGPTVAVLLGAALAGGCERRNPDYCCVDEASCRPPHGDGEITPCTDEARSYCDVQGLYGDKIPFTCVPPPTVQACDEDRDCQADPDLVYCVEGQCRECNNSTACGSDAPVCSLEYECSGCSQEADCASHSVTPHCGTSGACVACRSNADCSLSLPVCDSGSSTCTRCTSDSQCDSLICQEAAGICQPEGAIIYVATDGTDNPTCARGTPCKTLKRALQLVTTSRATIWMAPGAYQENGNVASQPVTISAGRVAVVAKGASLSRAPVPPDPEPAFGPVIVVEGPTTEVTIEGLRLHGGKGNLGDGLRCTSGTIVLSGVTLNLNQGMGIQATDNCSVTVEGSSIADNNRGLSTNGGTVTVRNTFFVGNGTDGAIGTSFGAVSISDPSVGSVFEFNTLRGNKARTNVAGGVFCTSTSAAIRVANNIIFENAKRDGTQVNNSDCTIAFNLSEDDLGGTNIRATPIFGPDGFHLAAGSPGINAVDCSSSVPVDFDGDPRPQPTGGRCDVGADEVRP